MVSNASVLMYTSAAFFTTHERSLSMQSVHSVAPPPRMHMELAGVEKECTLP